jgi:hypothetical protein
MAKVKAAELVEHLMYPLKQALGDALAKVAPDAPVDLQELFREFKKAVGRRCRPWENVPNNSVDCD